MRLEVLTDKKGPVIYVLNRPEIYIGSTENNDIVIANSEISKKHLKLIITDDGRCFVVDQGSTNGSFINDQRLIPGKREEFKLLSSMRLGDKILLTLLDKDTGQNPELPIRDKFVEENNLRIADEDKTRVISLKTLQKTKTETVKKKRLKKLEKELKKKKQARRDKATINRALMTALVIMGVGWAGMKYVAHYRKTKNKTTIVAQIKETQIMIDDSLESLEENIADVMIPQELLLPIADIAKNSEFINCSLPEEAFFCKRMPRGSRKKNGALNLNGQIVIYLELKEWLDKAENLVALHSELNADKKDDVTTKMLHRIAFLSYLKSHLSIQLPPEIQEQNLYVAFYSHAGASMEIESVTAIRGLYVNQVNARFSEDFFRFRKYDPYRIIRKLDRFYKTY